MTPRADVFRRVRGLYGLADADASSGDPVRLAASLLAGGCRLVQLRCKGWKHPQRVIAAHEIRARCAAVGATFIVNDHPDVAVEVNAHGVHIGQLDGRTDDVRKMVGPHRIIGRSTHDPHQLEQALVQADYVAFGPIFDTSNVSRPKGVRGLAALKVAAQCVAGRAPLVAIGGINATRLAAVHAAGADAWAIIGAIAGAPSPLDATRALLHP